MMKDQTLNFTYQDEDEIRLDKFLVTCLPDLSRSRIQGLIKDGFVKLNGECPSKAGQVISGGQEIEVILPAPKPSGLEPEDIPLDIVYEDQNLMVVNKPAGMVVHPAAGHYTGTLIQAALGHAPEMEGIGGEIRPGVVHRLDKDTSGLIIIAKNDNTHHLLQEQFRTRKVKKFYLALVDGAPPTPSGRVDAAIGRDPAHRKQMAIVSENRGRASVTEYFTRESFSKHTLLECHPLTGRTHQIRNHLAFIGCPIVGDTLYGHTHASLPVKRQFLHAFQITITLPGEKEPRCFNAPLPADLEEILISLRNQ
jgi:23S rRNA pseudouridine1911/1915/1917 synthase